MAGVAYGSGGAATLRTSRAAVTGGSAAFGQTRN